MRECAGSAGLEPATFGIKARRNCQLFYEPIKLGCEDSNLNDGIQSPGSCR